jgi:antitoxin HicB
MSSMRPDKVSRERAKMTIAYPMWLAWSKEDHAYHVRSRDLPEVLTAGSTKAEALEMAADALEVALAGRIEDEEDIPAPSKPRKREHLISLPAQLAAKLPVYRAWRAAGISKVALAKKLGIAEGAARRILNPRYGTKLDRLEAALATLGHRLVIDSRPMKRNAA